MNNNRAFFVGQNMTTFIDDVTAKHIAIELRNREYTPFHDLTLAVFELGRLWVNGENDLEYTLERLAIHNLKNYA